MDNTIGFSGFSSPLLKHILPITTKIISLKHSFQVSLLSSQMLNGVFTILDQKLNPSVVLHLYSWLVSLVTKYLPSGISVEGTVLGRRKQDRILQLQAATFMGFITPVSLLSPVLGLQLLSPQSLVHSTPILHSSPKQYTHLWAGIGVHVHSLAGSSSPSNTEWLLREAIPAAALFSPPSAVTY